MSIIYDVDGATAADPALGRALAGDVAYDPIAIVDGTGSGDPGGANFAGGKHDALLAILDASPASAAATTRLARSSRDSAASASGLLATRSFCDRADGLAYSLALGAGGDSGSLAETSLETSFSASFTTSTDVAAADDAEVMASHSADLSSDIESFVESYSVVALDAARPAEQSYAIVQSAVAYAAADPAWGSESAPAPTAWSADVGSPRSAALAHALGGESGSGSPGTFDLGTADEAWRATAVLVAADAGHAGEASGLTTVVTTSGYNIYANSGDDGPIDYTAPIATVVGLNVTTWASPPLACPGAWKLGVRAYSPSGEERNLDCAVRILFDANGVDISSIPAPPVGLRAFPLGSGLARVEWTAPAPTSADRTPAGFRVYLGLGTTPFYGAPAAVVPYSAAILGQFKADLTALADATAYAVGVRAYNAAGEESNTAAATFTASASGPDPVDALTATAT